MTKKYSNIYTWDAKPAQRNFTIASIRACKGKCKLTQTTANTDEEASAVRDAGIDLIMVNAPNAKIVRESAHDIFMTVTLALPDYPTQNDVLKAAFQAMKEGADSIYTARGPHIVEMLAKEDIPVMCHLGLVPRKSTWHGGLRAIGRTGDEAIHLWQQFKTMENAGAFSVEAEVIPARIMEEISKRTSLITMSLGSGYGGDVIYLFQNDICGEESKRPRHARAFGNLHKLYQEIAYQRRTALKDFCHAIKEQDFPNNYEIAHIDDNELDIFLDYLK